MFLISLNSLLTKSPLLFRNSSGTPYIASSVCNSFLISSLIIRLRLASKGLSFSSSSLILSSISSIFSLSFVLSRFSFSFFMSSIILSPPAILPIVVKGINGSILLLVFILLSCVVINLSIIISSYSSSID